jgi:hypothetical protein
MPARTCRCRTGRAGRGRTPEPEALDNSSRRERQRVGAVHPGRVRAVAVGEFVRAFGRVGVAAVAVDAGGQGPARLRVAGDGRVGGQLAPVKQLVFLRVALAVAAEGARVVTRLALDPRQLVGGVEDEAYGDDILVRADRGAQLCGAAGTAAQPVSFCARSRRSVSSKGSSSSDCTGEHGPFRCASGMKA